jgi:hypothetical protein
MNDVLFPAAIETAKPLCQQCGETFEPRTGSGGKSRRFCSTKCRRQFHAAGPTPPTPDVGNESARTPIADEETPTSESANVNLLDDPANEVIADQERICVYLDWDRVVIAETWDSFEEPARIYVAKHNLGRLVDRLQEIRHDRWPPKPVVSAPPAPIPPPAPPPLGPPKEDEEDEDRWDSDDSRVIHDQPETFLYINQKGQIVIRQIVDFHDNPFVRFELDHARTIATRIVELANSEEKERGG